MVAIAALLLAAGESTRMGEMKALLPWEGTTLLEHQVSSLAAAGISRTVVVVGHRAEAVETLLKDRPGVYCAYNADYRKGKTSSMKAGLRVFIGPKNQGGIRGKRKSPDKRASRAGTPIESALLVLNVDQPRSTSTLRRITDAHLTSAALITIPVYSGKGGHPIIFSAPLWEEMLDISEETQGLKEVARRHSAYTHRFEMNTPEVLLDLNTPEEYQRALELLASH